MMPAGTSADRTVVVAGLDRHRLKRALGKQRRETRGPEGRVVVVHAAKGGAGASTLAANLAASLLAFAGPVALVDLAVEGGDQDLLWNLSPPLRLPDVVGPEGHELQDALQPHRSGVRILAGPASPEEAGAVPVHSVPGLLAELALRHPSVVVDTSATFDEVTLQSLQCASTILVPVMPELTALRATQRALAIWERLAVPVDRIMICYWDRRGAVDAALAARVLGRRIAFSLPWAPQEAHDAINAGEPPAAGRGGRSPLARATAALAAALVSGAVVAGRRPTWLARLKGVLA